MVKPFHLCAAALLTSLSLPAGATVTLTTEPMLGTGLPPGQTLPEPEPEQTAPAEPFTPKTVTAPQMQAWGPLAHTGGDTSTDSSNTSTNSSNTTTTRPAPRKVDRLQPRVKELRPLKPRRIEP